MAGKIGELYVAITGDNSDLTGKLNQSSNQVKKFGSDISSTQSKVVSDLKNMAIGFVGVQTAINAIATGINFNKMMQTTQSAFTVMLGSASDAASKIKELKQLADHTPLTFGGITDATKTLLQFGVASKDVVSTVKMLGDVAGGNQDRLNSLALAFGQMSSTGHLMGQDLLQMINAGFNPLQTISEKTGRSMADLKKDMENGAISTEMVTQAFKDATSEGGKFYGMMEAQSKTLEGSLSTLSDAWATFMGAQTDALSGPLVTLFQDLSKALNDNKSLFTDIGNIMAGFIVIADGVVNVISMITSNLNSMAVALTVVVGGLALLNPIAAVIGGLAAAVALVAKGISDNIEAQKKHKAAIEATTASLYELTVAGALAEKKNLKSTLAEIEVAKEKAKIIKNINKSALNDYLKDYQDYFKTKLQLLDEEEKAAIAGAIKANNGEALSGQELTTITAYYTEKRKELYDEDAKAHEDAAQEDYDFQMGLLDATEEAHAIAAKNRQKQLDEEQSKVMETQKVWSTYATQGLGVVTSAFEAMGDAIVSGKGVWQEMANSAIEAIAKIVEALGAQIAAEAAVDFGKAVAFSLNPATLAAAPGYYAQAAQEAALATATYTAAGAIGGLANFGAGTASVSQTGSYLVGEYGRELVTLPQGASVMTNARTEASMGNSTVINNTFTSPKALDEMTINRMMTKQARQMRLAV